MRSKCDRVRRCVSCFVNISFHSFVSCTFSSQLVFFEANVFQVLFIFHIMEFTLFFLALALFWKMSSALQCFKCDPDQTYNGQPQCSQFDSSENYLVNCEHSTMCFKKETTLKLSNGRTSTSTERGCASQRLSGDQAKINGKWQLVDTIYEVYEEACKEAPSATDGPIKTVHCFCRGDQCNTSSYHIVNFNLFILVICMYFFR